jgi:anti-sigma factor RsiW
MTDCPNAEMRDRLPDLLHERLELSARAVVVAHVEECVECRAELALLREARVALSSGMRTVDVTAIARVVINGTRPPSLAQSSTLVPTPRPSWMDWRIAASVALLVVGAGSYAVIARTHTAPAASTIDRPIAVAVPNESSRAAVVTGPVQHSAPVASSAPVPQAELSAAGGVGDLSESELRSLLNELDQIDAVPSTEPEPVNVRVSLPGMGRGRGSSE